MYSCASCTSVTCKSGDLENTPSNCPCNNEEIQEKVKNEYLIESNFKMARNSALVESEGYCKKTRIEEIMDFARKNKFKNLGIAFCTGLKKEAEIFTKILRANGFQPSSIICKNGAIPKEFIGISDCEKVRPNTNEMICNPIAQAELFNENKTDLNIILGLCVGHDSLFIKYSNAPVTVLAAKDRVTAHNPLAPLYTSTSYYSKLLK